MKFEVGDIIRIKNEEPLIILSTPIKDAQIKADYALFTDDGYRKIGKIDELENI